ncbi:arylsulfatase J-like isoform X2 [Mytilus edulis]|uniref:arylsulfatase J-like isoform X2 n=1 Tax=Mytilus edulis TaxID=6550 RepID=UPI0039F095FC
MTEPVIHTVLFTFLVFLVEAASRPNIVVIVADDLGWNDVSFHGSDQISTPHLDELAYKGVLLKNYYVSPICTPTRGALMSGRHPIHTGLQHSVILGSEPYGLPLNVSIMPEWLQKLGYRTHMVGKWHLGFFRKEYTPLYRGFESHYGYYLGCGDYYDHSSEATPDYFGYDFWRNDTIDYTSIGQYSTDIFTKEAVNIINNHNPSEPLFLYLPYQAVHSGNLPDGNPLQAPQKYIKRFPHIKNTKRRTYAGMVSALDDAVGTVVDALKSQGLYDNSVILFTTDNGGPANGFDGNAANNFPLRGVKATLWEGGVRGTGFVHSPILQKQGYTAEQMIHVCDWLPTLYRAAGGDPKQMKDLDGYDLWDMLSNNAKSIRTGMLHNIDPYGPKGALREGDYKLLYGKISKTWGGWYPPWQVDTDSETYHYDKMDSHNIDEVIKYFSVSNQNSKEFSMFSPLKIDCGPVPANASTNCDPERKPCLYHIPSDPCEFHNIADQHPVVVKKMMDIISHYNSTMVPPLNTHQDPAGNPRNNNGAWVPWMK